LHRLLVLSMTLLVIAVSFATASPSVGEAGAWGVDGGGPEPTVGSIVGFRDDFTDQSNVSASSGVIFSGLDARLPNLTTMHRGSVLAPGPGWDSSAVGPLAVIHEPGLYKMWHSGCSGGCQIGYATSADGRTWAKQGIVLTPSLPLEGSVLSYGDVIKVGAEYRMWYSGSDGTTFRIFAANSTDGIAWNKQGLVLDLGSPGSPDDRMVFAPSVVYDAGTYRMWYSASSNANVSGWVIATARSSDGLSWIREGVVLRAGPPGASDSVRVWEPSVRRVGALYEMIYTASDGTYERLLLAESSDGIAWQKRGLIVDVLPPEESPNLQQAALWVESDGTWLIYYAGAGSQYQVFLSTRPATDRQGWLRSVPIAVPAGLDWGWFNQTVSVSPGCWVNVTVRDGSTLSVVNGIENVTAGTVDIRGVDAAIHSSLVFEGWLARTGGSTPILDAWDVTWLDARAPSFLGLDSATDLGTSGSVHLAWFSASDWSGPITYSVYQAEGLGPFDFGVANYTLQATSLDVSGLANGVLYRFVVRASDRWGNQDGNTLGRTVIPTTPVDDTPPAFAGLAEARDAGTGGALLLVWPAATDPDTLSSNSDPSVPVEYLVFGAASSGSINYSSPARVTMALSATVSGLVDGTEYQFAVRARDAQGNLETNTIIRRATPTHVFDSTPPTFAGAEEVLDLGTGEGANVTWSPASDPDTPESNVDPSLPITYSVYVGVSATGLGTGTPNTTVSTEYAVITGIVPGRTYYVLVRATDAAGNTESNTRVISFEIAPRPSPPASYWWILVLLNVVLALVGVAVIWYRRRSREPPPPA